MISLSAIFTLGLRSKAMVIASLRVMLLAAISWAWVGVGESMEDAAIMSNAAYTPALLRLSPKRLNMAGILFTIW